jgi:ABC-type multidrug transport system fused ATPase/permease subunit
MLVGTVGSGKSSMLKSILKELHLIKGKLLSKGRLSWVPQEPFLLNDTLRNNILFGNAFDVARYSRVVSICELAQDIDSLKGGEFAEIGEKGINLSGGQKQRISLARALYQEADIYLIDDSLSALDAHVGRKIFYNVIVDELLKKGKTVILTTHVLTFLNEADEVVFLYKGVIECKGSFESLKRENASFMEFIQEEQEQMNKEQEDGQDNVKNINKKNRHKSTLKTNLFNYDPRVFDEFQQVPNEISIASIKSKNSENVSIKINLDSYKINEPNIQIQKGKLVKQERKEKGHVKGKIFLTYFTSGGTCFFITILFFFILSILLNMGGDYWVSLWTSNQYNFSQSTYLKVYGLFLGLLMLSILIKGTLFGLYCMAIGLSLFDKVLLKIIKKPMAFFDVTPSGQLLNLTGKDADLVDDRIGNHSSMTIDGMLRLIGILILAGIANFLLTPAIICNEIYNFFFFYIFFFCMRS